MEENVKIEEPIQPATIKTKKLYYTDKSDNFMTVCSLISAVMLVLWAFFGNMCLGWTLTFDFYIAACSVYLHKKGEKASKYGYLCGILSLLMSLNFMFTSNFLINFFSFFAMLVSATVYLASLSGKKLSKDELSIFSLFFSNTFGCLSFLPVCARSILKTDSGKTSKIKKIIIGLAVVLPLLCIIIPLLTESDDAFDSLIGSMFDDIGETILKVVLILVFCPLLLCFAFTLKHREVERKEDKNREIIDSTILATIVFVISAVYVAYLSSQLAYFFSAFSSILPEGYSFSFAEYARKGFFEMCAIAFINFIIIYVCVTLSKKNEGKMPVLLKSLCCFIALFTLILIATAESKMVLYIKNYGMTSSRICTGSFMIMLFLTFIILIAGCFSKKVRVLEFMLSTCSIILIFLGIGNVNSYVAEYNYNAWKSGKLETIDTSYISELGPEGIPTLIKILKDDENDEYASWTIQDAYRYNYYDSEIETVVDTKTQFTTKCTPNKKLYSKFYELSIPLFKMYRELDKFAQENPDILMNTEIILDGDDEITNHDETNIVEMSD